MRFCEGDEEQDIVIGNSYNKYQSQNPLVKIIMAGFDKSLVTLVNNVGPKSIHEVGCGEGYWVIKWHQQGLNVRGSDFSSKVIELAKENAKDTNVPTNLFKKKSIYDLSVLDDQAELIVCCEVLEHLDNPAEALKAIQRIATHSVIFSVPREPLWRTLNVLRGKYIKDLGNTPGHIQHWSSKSIVQLLSQYFEIIEIKKPFPWTMILCSVK